MREYEVGDLVKASATFTDPDDNEAPIDPTEVSIRILSPSSEITEFVYDGNNGSSLETDRIWRSAEGVYHFNISLTEAGVHYYYWFSTGEGQAADREYFKALPGVDAPVGT